MRITELTGRYGPEEKRGEEMAQVFFGGSYPGDMKAATSEKAIEQLAPPARVILSLSQHDLRQDGEPPHHLCIPAGGGHRRAVRPGGGLRDGAAG